MGQKQIIIKSFNGIGDLLFVTPTLRRIKERYGSDAKITVNTNYPDLLIGNPHVDVIGRENEGVFLGYPDPIHRKWPEQHHIYSDWEIVSKAYELDLDSPADKPEVYPSFQRIEPSEHIGVQVMHKGHWHAKKVWPNFEQLAELTEFYAIPKCDSIYTLMRTLCSFKGIVCAEGGISHLARALDIPCVVIYGGFASPKWNGYREQTNLCNEKHCSYCYNQGPCEHPVEERICMKEITIEDVKLACEGFSRVDRVEMHNAMAATLRNATNWCRGRGLDIGGGRNPFPFARCIEDNEVENAYTIKERDDSMNYIISSHCLEHLEDPAKALKEWNRVLRPGGILYLYLPNTAYHRWRKENMPKWHKHNLYLENMIWFLVELGMKIKEVKERDAHFGMTIIARKAI